jgi:beta-glucosidase
MNRRDWLKIGATASAASFFAPLKGMELFKETPYSRSDFGNDFEWGVATAAYQIEGAWNLDGKGPSVWDTFTHRKGKIKTGENGDTACDFYHRYPEDIGLMRRLSIPNNRFSIAWSRIFPEGKGSVNAKGIDFYHRVIDESLKKGVEPWVTCFHWDTPQALEDQGGWTNRDIVGWFSDFVDRISREYGDKVKHWMVLNEPMAFVGLGYMLGIHAPGRKGLGNFLPAVHHASLAQAEGGRLLRANVANADIGTTFSATWMDPWKGKTSNEKGVERMEALFNRLFIEPSLGLGYPEESFKGLRGLHKHMKPGDAEKLAFDFDFIGLQNYTRDFVQKWWFPPMVWARLVPVKKRGEIQTTEMNWEVYPEGIYNLLKWLHGYGDKIKRIIVTENGAAFPDQLDGDRVHDEKRKKFIIDYLGQVLRAKQEGVNVQGYFIWSFMDNFEWAEGFKPRFGLVHVDFETQKRTIKDSGYWYSDFLAWK